MKSLEPERKKYSKPIPKADLEDRRGTRWETLHDVEYVAPKPQDYMPAKTGGGWFRHPNKAPRNPMPYKTDLSLYSIEFSRVQVPEKYDQSVLPPDKNDAYIKYRDGFAERAPYQTAYNDMSFLHNKVPAGGFNKKAEIVAAEEYRQRKEREEREREDREREFLESKQPYNFIGCGHGRQRKPRSLREDPVKFPLGPFDPANVELDRPLSPPPKKTCELPPRVTEDDVRNEIRYGPRGTKGFFASGSSGMKSFTGDVAAEMYYRDIRPYEGTLCTINANRSIKSAVMQ